MHNTLEKLQHYLIVGAKIFIIGMVIQFLTHTIFTYGIRIPSWMSFIWLWKEILILMMGGASLRGIWKFPDIRKSFLGNLYHQLIIITIIIAGIIALANSIFIHHQSIMTFFVSAKYNFFPLMIAVVGILIAHIITKSQFEELLNTFITTLKYVLGFSVIRYAILHTIPNSLDWIGFAQPGMSIEWSAGSPPPSLYLTEFYSGHVRNQGPFGGPLSLGFYLVGLRPLFFTKVLYKKNLSDTRGWYLLYISMVWSTFSRAAWGIFIIASIALAIILYRKYANYIIGGGVLIFLASIIYIITGGESQFLVRTRSDQGHIEFFKQGVQLVRENRLRGLGAASVGPGSHQISNITEVFNPENQYMQIWLEYGLLGLIGWLLAYIIVIYKSMRQRLYILYTKASTAIDHETIFYIGISIAIISLSIAGIVLHPFTDSGSMYPIMLWIGLSIGTFSSHHNVSKNIRPLWSLSIFSGLKIWSIFIASLFTIQTILSGLGIIENPLVISSIRDSIRIGSIIFLLLKYKKLLGGYLQSFYLVIIPISIVLFINIMTLLQGYYDGEFLHILAGIKYDIHYLMILLGSLWIGYIVAKTSTSGQLQHYIYRFAKFAIGLIIISVVWQLSKNIRPEFFLHYLGFSTPNDFIPFTQPPIYYLTGPGGMQRFSGLFIGPNTLGFFLIGLFGLLSTIIGKKMNTTYQRIVGILYLILLSLTYSRGVIVGHAVVGIGILLLYPYMISKNLTTTNIYESFKHYWKHIVALFLVSGILFLGINQWKDTSNKERFDALEYTSIKQLITRGGQGPGFIGPAKHYESSYLIDQKNQYSMIENIYMQTLINQGILGIILMMIILGGLIRYHYIIKSNLEDNNNIHYYTQLLGIGLGGLLIVGRYLHVFIDSMVNYLFFMIYGMMVAYSLTTLSTKKQ